MKKSIYTLLGILLILALMLSACKTNPTEEPASDDAAEEQAPEEAEEVDTEDDAAEAEEAEVEEEEEAPVEYAVADSFTIMRSGDSWDPDNAYLQLLIEATGITVEYEIVPTAEYAEKRNVVMSGGSGLPQVIQVGITEEQYTTYLDDEMLLPLDDYLARYPLVWEAFPEDVWDAIRADDGHIYSIPRVAGIYPQTLNYRADWLAAMGMEEPTTLDEMNAFLTAVAEQNPGNIDSTLLIPFVPNRLESPGALSWVDAFFAAYGVPYNTWLKADDGSIEYFATKPEFKDALLYLRGLISDGLMDETFLLSTDRGLFKYYAGNTAVTTDWPQFINLRREAIENAYPDAAPELGYIAGLVGPEGFQGGPVVTPDARGGTMNVSLTYECTPEQAEAFFKVLEWQWTEGYQMMTLGVEGKSFDYVDDVAVRRGRDAVLEDDPEYDLYMLDRLWMVEPPKNFAFRSDNPSFSGIPADEMAYVKTVLADAVDKAIINYALFTNDARYQDYIGDISLLVDEYAASVILNPDFDADAGFDDLQTSMAFAGLEDATAAINELNDTAMIESMFDAMVAGFLQAMEE